MKTEQEQIKAIKQIIDERVETTLGQVQGRHDNVIKTVDTVIIARDIVEAGYGDVSEYKAEREMLGSQIKVLKQRLNNKYVEIERLKDDYAKLQEQFAQYQMASDKEIKAQKKEAEQLFESNMKAVLEIEKKQAQIDVLNFLKDGYEVDISTSTENTKEKRGDTNYETTVNIMSL